LQIQIRARGIVLHINRNLQKLLVFIIVIVISVTLIVVYGPNIVSTLQPDVQDNQQLAYDATVYGFPLVVMDFTRQVLTAVPASNTYGAPVNQFGNKRTIPNASFTNVVNPNADTLYSAAWVDTEKEPIILSVPDTHGRYYLMPMFNLWTDCFASPGSRTTGTGPGDYAITGPNWNGTLPDGITEMKSSTRWVWIVGRIACAGPSDYQNVWALQNQLKLTPLSAWGTDYTPPINVPVDPNVNARLSPLNQTLSLDAATYFNYVCQLMVDNPPYSTDAPLLTEIAKIGITPGANYTLYFDGLSADVKAAIESGYQAALAEIPKANMGTVTNGWQFTYSIADFKTNYALRATVAYRGLGGNLIEDAFYASATKTGDGTNFSSDKQFVLHFSKEEVPPVNGFWSLSLYNSQIMFVDNPINRYMVGSLSDPPLITNPDGSIDIYIQRDQPSADKLPNWLPAPASGNFSLTLRLYWPQQTVIDKAWIPPTVQLVK
jgi:hypothetical protein